MAQRTSPPAKKKPPKDRPVRKEPPAKRGPTKAAAHSRTKAGAGKPARKPSRARRPFVIDFHAHVVVPEVQQFSKGHVVDTSPRSAPSDNPAAAEAWRIRLEQNRDKMFDLATRLRIMDEAGVDLQVLTPSLVHQYTYWAEPQAALAMEQLSNERIAEMVAKTSNRFVGLGSVPLQAPELAVAELERCMNELGLRGIEISSHAHPAELGDAKLRPFWAACERMGAAVYLHPSGVIDERYKKFQLWNSVGQPLEEALAMSSLFYEGVLDAYPKLKICVAHGGGYLPFAAGRVDRNYLEKAHTRVHMKKSPSEYLRKNFWYDSCVYNVDMLEFLARKVGAARIVMGSDYPVGEHDPVGFVMKARGLSAVEKEAILGKTAAKLLGLSI